MLATDHALRRNGVDVLSEMVPARELLAFLQAKPQYPGHFKGQPSPAHSCWAMTDVLQAPGVLDLIARWTPVAGDYLDADPLVYSVNAFTMYPFDGPTSRDTQEFHRDKDDTRFLALFVYLTDVLEPDDGAHQYQVGTQHGFNRGDVATIVGRAGTMFLSDGKGLHRGIRPTTHARTILWIRWGVSDPPPAYQWCGTTPVEKALVGERYPTDPVLQRQIRLVLA